MPDFRCEACNYNSKLKTNFNRHLTSNKHLKNVKKMKETNSLDPKTNTFCSQMTPKIAKMSGFCSQMTPNDSQMTPNTEKPKISKEYVCPYCSMVFSRKTNLTRHMFKSCNDNIDLVNYKYLYEMEKKDKEDKMKEFQKEKDNLYKQIEKLLEKVGDTNNFTQNIVLNNYGNEDLTHITKAFKNSLLKGPYTMIPKFIEAVHFSKKCPENKNICLPNKNKPYLKIFHDGTWKYKDKKEGIQELIDINYTRLDNEYSDGEISLDKDQDKRYLIFKSKVNSEEEGTLKKIEKDIELVLLNQI